MNPLAIYLLGYIISFYLMFRLNKHKVEGFRRPTLYETIFLSLLSWVMVVSAMAILFTDFMNNNKLIKKTNSWWDNQHE